MLVGRILLVSALMLAGAYGVFLWDQQRAVPIEAARTAAVNVFVMGELFYLFNCRSLEQSMFRIGVFSNRWIVGGVLAMVGLLLVLTYAPVMYRLFHTAPINGLAWVPILATGLAVYAVVGNEKWIRLRLTAKRSVARRSGQGA